MYIFYFWYYFDALFSLAKESIFYKWKEMSFLLINQNPEGDEELSQAFSGMGAEGPGDDFMPMMQGLMQTLLSKDILYPSLKEISAKVTIS